MLSFFKKKDEDLTNGKKRLPVFDELSAMIDPVDIPLGLPTFKEYSEEYTLNECEILLKEIEKLKKGYLSKYEKDYISDFEKSLESIIYVKSHPEELENIEFYNI